MGVHIKGNMFVMKEPKTFHFDFDLHETFSKNLKHEIKLIIIRNESLAEQRIKIEIEGLLYKYKHGNNIHEYRKQ